MSDLENTTDYGAMSEEERLNSDGTSLGNVNILYVLQLKDKTYE